MNAERFVAVCKSCDSILLDRTPTIERVSIPWIHPIRPHPTFLKNYEDIENISIIKIIIKISINLASLGRSFARALLTDGMPWRTSKTISYKNDILFFSHVTKTHQLDNENDFFYGTIPAKLAANGIGVTLVYLNASGRSAKKVLSACSNNKQYLILESVLSLRMELYIFVRLVREMWRLKTETSCLGSLEHHVRTRASIEAISSGSRFNLRLAEQVNQLVRVFNPSSLVVTYEGHAWERVVFGAARQVSPTITCVGYQHSIVFKHHHALTRRISRIYDADCIYTSGSLAVKLIEEAIGSDSLKVRFIGSSRPSINFQGQIKRSTIRRPVCVVLPEGIKQESDLLFHFTIACAWIDHNISFIWRPHPNQEEQNRQILKTVEKIPRNLSISINSLEGDLEISDWALYRGSSAIIYAVSAGLTPVYLAREGEISIDPLHDISNCRSQVHTPNEFVSILRVGLKGANSDIDNKLKAHCPQLISPIDSSELDFCIRRLKRLGQKMRANSL